MHIARATGKDDSEDGSSDENSSKKGKKRQGPGAANKSGPNKAGMQEVKEATQESSPDAAKRGAGNPATR